MGVKDEGLGVGVGGEAVPEPVHVTRAEVDGVTVHVPKGDAESVGVTVLRVREGESDSVGHTEQLRVLWKVRLPLWVTVLLGEEDRGQVGDGVYCGVSDSVAVVLGREKVTVGRGVSVAVPVWVSVGPVRLQVEHETETDRVERVNVAVLVVEWVSVGRMLHVGVGEGEGVRVGVRDGGEREGVDRVKVSVGRGVPELLGLRVGDGVSCSEPVSDATRECVGVKAGLPV